MNQLFHTKLLFKRLGIVLMLFTIIRIMFVLFNTSYFWPMSFTDALSVIGTGIRVDLVAMFYVFSIFIIAHLIPIKQRDSRRYQNYLKWYFYIFCLIIIYLECSDFVYYPFSAKRTGTQNLGMTNDVKDLAWDFIKDFYYIAFIVFALFIFARWMYVKTLKDRDYTKRPPLNKGLQAGIMVLFILVSATIVRGFGSQVFSPGSVVRTVKPAYADAAMNTTFNVLFSLTHRRVKEVEYMSYEEAKELYSIQHVYPADSMNRKNVVIIMLESFSKEFTGYDNPYPGYTPFIDSLAKHSLLFTNAFANGKHSMEGAVAITSGIPALTKETIITNQYSKNRLQGMGTILKQAGYKTYFFHGAKRGSMFFDQYMEKIGIDEYHGKEDYPNEEDFDGSWGILDGPFFQYAANTINKGEEPFAALIFSLSSHHPYPMPDELRDSFDVYEEKIYGSIRYTDHALRTFFDSARKMPWYDNTLFIITADHCYGKYYREEYKSVLGEYRIPLLFFMADSSLVGRSEKIVQQTDILPSVIDFLDLEYPFTAFGTSVFREEEGMAFFKAKEVYAMVYKNYLLLHDGTTSRGYYNIEKDPLLENDIMLQSDRRNEPFETEMEINKKLEAIIQIHNHSLVNDKLTPDE